MESMHIIINCLQFWMISNTTHNFKLLSGVKLQKLKMVSDKATKIKSTKVQTFGAFYYVIPLATSISQLV